MTYNPNVTLAKLYEATSKKGAVYFRGRMGMANVVLLKSDQVSDSGQPIWYLKVQEPEQRSEDQRQQQPRVQGADRREVETSAARGYARDDLNDPIPF